MDDANNHYQGVVIEDVTNGHVTLYTGSREDLIRDGVCVDAQFPVGRKRTSDGPEDGPGNRRWSIKYVKAGIWQVRKENEVRRTPKIERGADFADHEAWRLSIQDWARGVLHSIDTLANGQIERKTYGDTTIRLDNDSLVELREALKNVQDALASAQVIWVGSVARVQRALPAAKNNAQLQSFIRTLRADAN